MSHLKSSIWLSGGWCRDGGNRYLREGLWYEWCVSQHL